LLSGCFLCFPCWRRLCSNIEIRTLQFKLISCFTFDRRPLHLIQTDLSTGAESSKAEAVAEAQRLWETWPVRFTTLALLIVRKHRQPLTLSCLKDNFSLVGESTFPMMLFELASILSFTSRTAPIEGEEARSDKGVVTPTSELSYDPDLLKELDDPKNEHLYLPCIYFYCNRQTFALLLHLFLPEISDFGSKQLSRHIRVGVCIKSADHIG
jgi:hypothetical protein